MEEYEKMAIKLAKNREILNEFKQRLNHNKLKTKLFDSKKFTVNIEIAYTKMYENYHEDKALDHIVIK
jgi:predicted O-linked N-acetylglucosamine transferase (SPINDLY family)